MASGPSGLPSRFPVGTKFVIEGRPGGNGRVFSRYLEFPDGTRVRLPRHGGKAESRVTAGPAALPCDAQPPSLSRLVSSHPNHSIDSQIGKKKGARRPLGG